MNLSCAISGLDFSLGSFSDVSIPSSKGYFHPIFAASHNQLYALYSKHCKGLLTYEESYLLFLAFLHSSELIEWSHSASLEPESPEAKKLIQNSLTQLISAIEKTATIHHPSFFQPTFRVTEGNASLGSIPNWIKELEEHIEDFLHGVKDARVRNDILKVENKLSALILSGEKPEKYAHVIADWAAEAATFPADKATLYKQTIRACFNMTKMFNTPLALLKEIKEFCECNIEAGSIHFHTLHEVLTSGISKHLDYLGGSSLALGYTILDPSDLDKEAEVKGTAELAAITAQAPAKEPLAHEYKTSLEFLKAKLAYRAASFTCNSPINKEKG